MDAAEIPQELRTAAGAETIDFAVRAGRMRPFGRSLPAISFGILIIAVTSVFIFIFMAASPSEAAGSGSDMIMILVLAFFILIGFIILVSGFVKALRSGGWYAGTPKRLLNYRNGRLTAFNWQDFSGETEVTGNEVKGTVLLVIKKSSDVLSGRGYVPGLLYLTSINDAFQIEKIIRRRIKENDPTPPVR